MSEETEGNGLIIGGVVLVAVGFLCVGLVVLGYLFFGISARPAYSLKKSVTVRELSVHREVPVGAAGMNVLKKLPKDNYRKRAARVDFGTKRETSKIKIARVTRSFELARSSPAEEAQTRALIV